MLNKRPEPKGHRMKSRRRTLLAKRRKADDYKLRPLVMVWHIDHWRAPYSVRANKLNKR